MKYNEEELGLPWSRYEWNIITNVRILVAKMCPWDKSGCRKEDVSEAEFIIHAANMHFELVEALEKCSSAIRDLEFHGNESTYPTLPDECDRLVSKAKGSPNE